MTALRDLASQVRSKNAGPLRLAIDLFFDGEAAYERARDSPALSAPEVARRYGIAEDRVLGIYALDRIHAIKITLERPVPAGDVADTDVYGTQQHVPLLDLEV